MILYNRWRASFFPALSLLAVLVALPAQGQIVYTGDYLPTDPESLDINPDPKILDIGFTSFTVGEFGASTLNISNGWSLADNHANLGRQGFSSGEATIDGIGSSWINLGYVNLGNDGTGTLNLINGGLLETVGIRIHSTRGTLNWDNGTIRIRNDSADDLLSGGSLFLGKLVGQTQILELKGAASSLDSNELIIGYLGHGSLLINGGMVTSFTSDIGSLAGSTGIATITAGNWTNNNYIYVGYNGTGTLNIAGGTVEAKGLTTDATKGTVNWTDGTVRINGGTLTGLADANNDFILGYSSGAEQNLELLNGSTFNSNNSVIGNALGAVSSVTVQGGGSTWLNTGDIDVGLNGNGVLNIDGGTVEAYNLNTHATNGTVNWTAGLVRINGGTATGLNNASDNFILGQLGKVQHFELLNGGTYSSNESEIGYDSSVTLRDNGTRWFNSGDINIGLNGPGELNIDGGIIEAQNINTVSGNVNWTRGRILLFGGTATGLTDGSNDLILGQSGGDQHLELIDGATFSNSNSLIDSNSSVTVEGSDSIWSNSGNIDIDFGQLAIAGGTVEAQNINTLAQGSVNWTSGTARINGGTATGLTDLSDDLILDSNHHLELLDGAIFSNNNSTVDAGSSVLVRNSTWTNTGDINVGLNTAGVLDIEGGTVDAHSINIHATQGTVNWTDGTVRINGGTASGLGGASNAILLGLSAGTSQHLKLLDGGSMSSTADASFLGFVEDATGTLSIDGTDSSWINSGDVHVGGEGTGILNIHNGGQFEAQSIIRYANGTVNWTDGTVRIHDGSAVGLLIANNYLRLGTVAEKSQHLELSSGAFLNAVFSYIGDVATASGSALIDGPGSSIHSSSNVYIGYLGQGDVIISNGGSMSSGSDVYIGRHAGASGEVTVDGPESVFSGRIVFAGYSGAGALNILNGGTVDAVSLTVYDTMNWVDGTLRINGGTVTGITDVSNTLRLGTSGTQQHLELTAGTNFGVTSALIGASGAGQGSLNVVGPSGFSGQTISLGGTGSGGGDLNVTNGGTAFAGEAYLDRNGTATITGLGSIWTISTVFDIGNGTVNIAEGGVVNSPVGLANLGYLLDSDGHVAVDGFGSVWNNDTGHLRVGILGQGSLDITNGGSVNNTQGYIGYFAPPSGVDNGHGNVTVDGPNSAWVNRHDLIVGREGNGVLRVSNGGAVSSLNGIIASDLGATGSVTITDAGSSWQNAAELTVGNQSNGTLNISNGGLVTNTDAYIGRLANSNGEVTIDGTASAWISTGVVSVGNDGIGTLNLRNGGTLEAYSLDIHASNGTLNKGDGTIRINGGSASGLADANNDLKIVSDTLELNNGTSITTSRGFIGYNVNSFDNASGSVLVAGSGSMWIMSNDLHLGIAGFGPEAHGSLTISNGGKVQNHNAYIGYDNRSTGSVIVDGPGAIWDNSGQLDVSREGQGTLEIKNGGTVNSAYGNIGFSKVGSASVVGTDSSWNITTGGLNVAYAGIGTLNVSNGGHVNIAGDLSMSLLGGTSMLNFTLASLTDPLIDVAGGATLNGTLNVNLAAGLKLVDGDTFILIEIGLAQTGVFSNYAEGDLIGTFDGVDLFLSYLGGDGNDVAVYAVPAEVMFSDGFEAVTL